MPSVPGLPRPRATKLTPLLWLITTFAVSLVGTGWGAAPPTHWVQVFLAVLLGLTFAQFSFAYTYLLIRDRPALDSEEHTQEMARINKGVGGSNDAGVRDEVTEQARTPNRT